MAATFIIEVCLLGFVILRYGTKTTLHRLTAITLVALAIFQLAEYNVCGRFNVNALTWSRIGFVAIALLPPLGLHMVHLLANIKRRWLVILGYVASATWIYTFVFSSIAFQSHQCAGNYAIFQLANGIGGSFFFYYYAILFVALIIAGKAVGKVSPKKSHALKGLIAGYCFFIVPTTIVNTLKPETMQGIPSIMCGFAILFALTLVFVILPAAEELENKSLTKHKRKLYKVGNRA